MKTLLFCTGYGKSKDQWVDRHSRWIASIERTTLDIDTILIPDDGSPEVPQWDGIRVISEGELPEVEAIERGVIYRFNDNLGRLSLYNYPGFYRSFVFAAEYAKKYNYEKVIHIESDAAVISDRMQDYLNNFSNGWETFWCYKYRLPETAIQVIAGDHLENYYKFIDEPYSKFANKPADPDMGQGTSWLPYSVNKSFVGDRYGENNGKIPTGVDYACQIENNNQCWWLFNGNDE